MRSNVRFAFKLGLINLLGCFCRKNYSTIPNVRVRFAPSPTGNLHLGGLRTAVYNYLFAKSHGGSFILRIEDTDRKRFVSGSIEQLLSDLAWAGVNPDEGPGIGGNFGPYLQSDRLELYKKEVQKLIDNGSAYRCFCTEKRLELMKKEAIRLNEVPKYDNRCRSLSSSEIKKKLNDSVPFVVRFKLAPGGNTFEDLVYGNISHDVAAIEGDPIIMKTDGYPTYHLANVVDDHHMKISHVLRGVEWQSSTPKHLQLYAAFNWEPPSYAHLPLLVNDQGKKFSKRYQSHTVLHFREIGYYPTALVNFITFTGGMASTKGDAHSPRTYSVPEIVNIFKLSYINKNACKLQFDQLSEFNRAEYARRIADEKLLQAMVGELRLLISDKLSRENEKIDCKLDDDYVKSIITWSPARATQLEDLISDKMMFLWRQPDYKNISNEDTVRKEIDTIKELHDALVKANDFDHKKLLSKFREISAKRKIKFAIVMKLMRICLTGYEEGPGVGETMDLLGKDRALERLKNVIEIQQNNVSANNFGELKTEVLGSEIDKVNVVKNLTSERSV